MTPRHALAAAAFWLAVGLVQIFNWGEAGPWKGLVLLALLLGAFLILHALRDAEPEAAPPGKALIALVIVLALGELAYGGLRLAHPRLIDMATTTLAAGQAMLAGGNPYTLPIDPELGGQFQGYKYLPVMPAVYLPLGLLLGPRGVLVTNMILQAGCVALMLRLGRGRAGYTAAALYLALPLVAQQLFAKGSTDLAAVLPLLAAFALTEKRPFASGICVGLSISAKLFPGLVFVPCLLPRDGGALRHYRWGIIAGLLPALPYLAADPKAFADNIFVFNALRPPDTTSWLAFAPDGAALLAKAAFIALFAAASFYVWRRQPPLMARCAIGAALTIAVILAAPSAHHNYMLWWLPFYALALAAVLQKPRAAL